jgi:para-aminobenzoate synthetase component I
MMRDAFFHLAEELDLALSPEVFRAAFPGRRAESFVLDGGGAPAISTLDRFAFMGAEPVASLRAVRVRTASASGAIARDASGRAIGHVVTIDREGRRDEAETVDVLGALRDFLQAHALPADVFDPRFPAPFRAGAVGYIGYECGQFLERLPCVPRPTRGMPDLAFAIHDWLLTIRRDTGRSWLSVVGTGSTPQTARAHAESTRDRVVKLLGAASATPRRRADSLRGSTDVRPRLDRDEYIERVAVAKRHIKEGDAFEICLTNAHEAMLARDDAWELFEELRRSNPAPFAAFLDLPEGAIVSSSPERFLSLDANGVAESRPIKGTRPRGATAREDQALALELGGAEKDRAENAMIVDLVRNDLGKVCRFGTVDTPELFAIESYATVHQLVSTVRGELDRASDGIDLLGACFPPGSMTGAPKIEAMSILERLEPVERGVYSGALGWIDLGGAMDLSVVIRTAVVADGVASFSVGGAIVADSDPAAEHEETEHKARAIVRALAFLQNEPAAADGTASSRERSGVSKPAAQVSVETGTRQA